MKKKKKKKHPELPLWVMVSTSGPSKFHTVRSTSRAGTLPKDTEIRRVVKHEQEPKLRLEQGAAGRRDGSQVPCERCS